MEQQGWDATYRKAATDRIDPMFHLDQARVSTNLRFTRRVHPSNPSNQGWPCPDGAPQHPARPQIHRDEASLAAVAVSSKREPHSNFGSEANDHNVTRLPPGCHDTHGVDEEIHRHPCSSEAFAQRHMICFANVVFGSAYSWVPLA